MLRDGDSVINRRDLCIVSRWLRAKSRVSAEGLEIGRWEIRISEGLGQHLKNGENCGAADAKRRVDIIIRNKRASEIIFVLEVLG